MKVLFSDVTYSYLFPGGKQVHVNKLFYAMKKLNVDIQYENWFDPDLKGDIIHYFGYNDPVKILQQKRNGYKIVYTHIVDNLTNRNKLYKMLYREKLGLERILPKKYDKYFLWKSLKYFDAIVYIHQNDKRTAIDIYKVDPNKSYVIPHAVDRINIRNTISIDKYLVSIGSIIPRKNTVLLAKICKELGIKIKFVGKPFNIKDEYYLKFLEYVDNKNIQYLGYVNEEEKEKILDNASGFVLLSKGESGCISVYEAAAKGLPLLLPNLPWATCYDNPKDISFCNLDNISELKNNINSFYQNSKKSNSPTFNVKTWDDIALMYFDVYKNVYEKHN